LGYAVRVSLWLGPVANVWGVNVLRPPLQTILWPMGVILSPGSQKARRFVFPAGTFRGASNELAHRHASIGSIDLYGHVLLLPRTKDWLFSQCAVRACLYTSCQTAIRTSLSRRLIAALL